MLKQQPWGRCAVLRTGVPAIYTDQQGAATDPACWQVGNESTVLGFIGAPFTLAAYSVEGAADKCVHYSCNDASSCSRARSRAQMPHRITLHSI